MSGPSIVFDPRRHQFRLEGRLVPNVTQILKDRGWIDTRWYTLQGRNRGSYVHRVTALLDGERLDSASVPPWALPYLSTWERAKRELGLEIVGVEQIVHKADSWAGIVDRQVRWEGRLTYLDIKTGGAERWHRLQLAAYGATAPDMPRLVALYLKPDRYRIREIGVDEAHICRIAWLGTVARWHANRDGTN